MQKNLYVEKAEAPLPEDPLEAHREKMRREEEKGLQEDQMDHKRLVVKEINKQHHVVVDTRKFEGSKKKKAKVEVGYDEEFVLKDPNDGMMNFSSSSSDEEQDAVLSFRKESVLDSPLTTTRVFYTSRTHSQLSQFCDELKKTKFFCQTPTAQSDAEQFEKPQIWSASLGSRAGLCVYEPVRSLGSATAVSDACQKKREAKGGCECNKKDKVTALALECMGSGLIDVEEIFKRGQRRNACSYYASRLMMAQCDLIVLPYQMLLHEATRKAMNLPLKDSIVVVDEAHNLIDAINSVYSATLTEGTVKGAAGQVASYLDRYRAKLSHGNLEFMKQIQAFLTGLTKMFASDSLKKDCLLNMNEFLFGINCDNINVFQLVAKIKESQIANVLRGFCVKTEQAGSSNTFYNVVHFLECLTNRDGDGRILQRVEDTKSVEFLLLSPEKCFEKFARECKSIILAGGTLSPVDLLANQLMSDTALKARVKSYSFDHVVSPKNVLLLSLASGPSNVKYDFKFAARSTFAVQNELLSALANLRRLCPAGVVVFFPSYAYQNDFFKFVQQNNGASRLGPLFQQEQKTSSSASVFEAYSEEVAQRKKAMLWSVVGGSLSEGINFSDDLARMVVMVGIPFANPNDVVIKERTKRMGANYVNDLAARAVNQSIGRAIRHINDYACIVLLDYRYTVPKGMGEAIPAWIRKSRAPSTEFGPSISAIAKFFREKNQ
jgi:chromosome transmission fidelity protein 1